MIKSMRHLVAIADQRLTDEEIRGQGRTPF
jgi:hypothetical protein